MSNSPRQSGFTLIEVAIVLVVLGSLFVGIMKGMLLVDSARAKRLADDFRNIPVYITAYYDHYRTFPGDDIKAATTFAGGISGNGNGVIDGNWNDLTGEPFELWQDLRMANLIPGYVSDSPPTNAAGGRMGVTSATHSPITGMKGAYVFCSDGIRGDIAKQLDFMLDDGHTDTGAMRVTGVGTISGGTAIPIDSIQDAQTYLVCMGYDG
jgi:prepilin-type N-terminal cleavage/methylation domain-containing protein